MDKNWSRQRLDRYLLINFPVATKSGNHFMVLLHGCSRQVYTPLAVARTTSISAREQILRQASSVTHKLLHWQIEMWSSIKSYLIMEQHSSLSKGSKRPIPHIADPHFHMVFVDFDQKWRDLCIRKNHRVAPMSPTHLGPPEARPGPRVQNLSWAPEAAGFGATRKICSNMFKPFFKFSPFG